MKKHFFNLLLLLLFSLLTFSCGKKVRSANEIEFWTLQLSPTFDNYFHKLISAYESEHPGIKIKWIDVPYDAVIQKLTASAAAGLSPDVVNLSGDFLSKFAGMDVLFDYRNFISGDSLRKIYLPNALDDCAFRGRIIALPWYLNTYAVLYNKELMKKAGYGEGDVPLTYTGAVEFLKEYKKRTGKFGTFWNIGTDSYLPMMLESEGISVIDSTLSVSRLNSADVIEKVDEWVSLYRSGYLPSESVVSSGASIIEPYQSGQVAFVFTGPVFLKRVRDNAPGVYANTGISSPLTGKTGAHELATMAVAVMKSSRNTSASADFALYVTNAVNQLAFCKLATIYPSTKATLSDSYFVSGGGTPEDDARIEGAKLLPSARRLRYFLKHPRFDELRVVFDEAVQKACLKKVSTREAFEEAHEQWSRILRKN